MKYSKKLLVILLTLIMAVAVLTVSASADYGQIASGDGWSASADSDFCNETHASAGDFIASHNEYHLHDYTNDDTYGYFKDYDVTITISGASGSQGGVHYIGEGYGYREYYSSSTWHTDYASVNYNLTGGTLVIDNGSNYTSYVTGDSSGGGLLVLSGTVYVNGTFANIATGTNAAIILNGNTTVKGTSVSYYGATYSEATIKGGTYTYCNSHNKTCPAGLTVQGGTVEIASNSPELQFLTVSGTGDVDLNGVGIANIDHNCAPGECNYNVSGDIGLTVSGSGKVTSTATGTGSNHNTIVGKTYGIKQTGGTIELTGYTIQDTAEAMINDATNHAGGAIWVTDNTKMELTNCDIKTVSPTNNVVGTNTNTTPTADNSVIRVDNGNVTITGNGSTNVILGSANTTTRESNTSWNIGSAYNTALEVNGGTVTVTDMAIDSAIGSGSTTIPVKVKNATVTLNGSTVVGGTTVPGTAITVENTSNKAAKLTLDGTVVVNAYTTGINAGGSGTTITMKAGTIQYGDYDRVDYGIDADNIAKIDITGGTINAKYYGIDADTVPDFSVENATIYVSSSGTSYGIRAKNSGNSTTPVLIKDSTITVNASDLAEGVYLNNSTMSVGDTDNTTETTISATSTAQNSSAYGVRAAGASTFTMNADTTITAKVGNSMTNAYGVDVEGTSTATMTDGKIVADVTGDTITNAKVHGIYNDSSATCGVTVKNGTIEVGKSFGSSKQLETFGIYSAAGKTKIENGTIEIYSGHNTDSHGVFVANGHVDMTGGTINMKYDHINGVQANGGSFNMGAEGQLALGTTKGGEDHPYIHFDPAENAGTGKVYGVYANGGAVELYAGEVDVTGVAGFTAVRVDAGSLQVLTNEKVNPAAEDADDEIVFTAKANTNGGTAFHAQGGTWAIRGNGATFQAETALQVYAHVDDALSGGSFIGMMKNTAAEKNLDDLFPTNHYLRNDSSLEDAAYTLPSDGTRPVAANVAALNSGVYTVTDAEWELRYALEADNTGKEYTMPVNITLDANSTDAEHGAFFGALPKQGDVDVSVGTHKLDLSSKTLSYGGDGAAAPDNQKAVLHISATGDLLTYTSVAGGKIEYTGANGQAALIGAGLLTNGKADAATPNGVTMLGTNEYTVYLVGGKYIQNSGTVGTGTEKTATGIMLAAGSPEVVINGGTVYGSTTGIRNHVTGTVTVNNGTITGGTDGIWQDANGTTNVYGGTITGTTGDGIKATAGTLNVTPATGTPVTITGAQNGINMTAGTAVTVDSTGAKLDVTGSAANGISATAKKITMTLTKNATITGNTNGVYADDDDWANTKDSTITVDGATIKGDTLNGLLAKDINEVTVSDAVADHTTITGVTGIQLEGNSNATVNSGKIEGTNGDGIILLTASKLTVEGGTITATANGINVADGCTADVSGGTITGGTNGVDTVGTTTISGGTVEGTTNGLNVTGGTTNISGGTVKGTNGVNTVGTTTISGGTVEGTTNGLNVTGGTTNISGGTVEGTNALNVTGGTVNVSGGTVTGTTYGLNATGGTVTVKGGTINGADLIAGAAVTVTSAEDGTCGTITDNVTVTSGSLTITGDSDSFPYGTNKDKNITVNGGTLTVTDLTGDGHEDAHTTVARKVVQSSGTVSLDVGTQYKSICIAENGKKLADMMGTNVTCVASTNPNNKNVWEKAGATMQKTVDDTTVKNVTISENTDGYVLLTRSEHVTEEDEATGVTLAATGIPTTLTGAVTAYEANTSVTLDRVALRNTTSGFTFTLTPAADDTITTHNREIEWTVKQGDADVIEGITLATLDGDKRSYEGTAITVTVDKTLAAGTYTITAKSVGDTDKTDTFTVTVAKTSLSGATVTLTQNGSYVYTGSEITAGIASVKVTVNGTEYTLVEGADKDYTVSGNTGTNVNDYTLTVTAVEGKDCSDSKTASWKITGQNIANATITITPSSYTADNTEKAPTINVKYGNTLLTQDTDYTVSGTTTATAAGTYTITITGAGNYAGTKTATWKINSAGGGGGGFVPTPTYTITCGTGVKADVASSASGKTITLTVSEGYENIVVKDADGKAVTVTGNTFKMPASDVKVTVSVIVIEPETITYDKCLKDSDCVLTAFTDVNNDAWYHDGIHYCLDNGMMNGVGDGKFAPKASTTRAMIWTILARLDGETITGAAWADDAKAWAVKVGTSDGTNPNGDVTREQLAAMLYRYAKLKGYDVSVGEDTNILSYDDAFSVSEYAVDAMQWAVGAGIIKGDNNNLKPTTGATRAEVATMLMRFCETVVK